MYKIALKKYILNITRVIIIIVDILVGVFSKLWLKCIFIIFLLQKKTGLILMYMTKP